LTFIFWNKSEQISRKSFRLTEEKTDEKKNLVQFFFKKEGRDSFKIYFFINFPLFFKNFSSDISQFFFLEKNSKHITLIFNERKFKLAIGNLYYFI